MDRVGPGSDEVFPWRDGQQFQLLIDSPQFFPAMLQAIDDAKSHVLMEMYIMESGEVADRFIDALLRATKRVINVQLLLDGFGSRGLSNRDRERLVEGGVQLAFYNPLRIMPFSNKFRENLFRTHRKFLVVDGQVAYVGGTAISDVFSGENAWHDCMLEIRGPGAADWQRLFANNVRRWADFAAPPSVKVAACKNGASGRLVYTSGGVKLPLKRVLLNRIRRSESRTWFASAYFIPSAKIRRALRRAASRGKDVRLLLPGPVTDHPAVRYASRRYYARLLRHGVRIFEYQEKFMHAKVVLVDDWCTIGSSNMDRWNFRWNLEANQEVEGPTLARDVQQMLLNDFECSEEIHYGVWLQRSWWQRWKERLWGKIDRWLAQ